MKRLILTGAATATAAVAGIAMFAGPAVAATPSSSPTTSTVASSCDRGPWQSPVQGAPSFKAGDPLGDYLWHTTTGFQLRVTHPGHSREVLTGEITSSAPMHVSRYLLERGDVLRLSANHRSLVFAFSDYGSVDGADFHTDCAATVTVSHLRVGNRALPAGDVNLGARKLHPARLPFTLYRRLVA